MRKIILLFVFLLACSSANTVTGEEVAFKGIKKCKTCHIKVYKTWKKSKHAGAFDQLKGDEQKDPKCIECHTTNKDVSLPGVQCEACHGAGGNFSSAKIMNKKKFKANPELQKKLAIEAGLIIAPDEKVCKRCHNERSPHYKGFDFEKRYEEIKHTNK